MRETMSGLSPDYFQMLMLLGRALHALRIEHNQQAVLVGGAAVEFYTGGGYSTGDFDVHFSDVRLFSEVLTQFGFLREKGPSRLLNSWYHPECPNYGVQVVSGSLFDGLSDLYRLQLVKIGPDADVIIPPIEDLVADRLGQYCSIPNNSDQSTLEQAKLLVSLAETIDWDYLERRVSEEQGDISLLEGNRQE
jgi:hypothetical protein